MLWLAQLDPSAPSEALTEMSGSFGSALTHMLVTFTAIIALLFVSFWFVRRLVQNRLQKGIGQQAIQILEKRMISPKTMLYWIQVEDKRILLAESHLEVRKVESCLIKEETPPVQS